MGGIIRIVMLCFSLGFPLLTLLCSEARAQLHQSQKSETKQAYMCTHIWFESLSTVPGVDLGFSPDENEVVRLRLLSSKKLRDQFDREFRTASRLGKAFQGWGKLFDLTKALSEKEALSRDEYCKLFRLASQSNAQGLESKVYGDVLIDYVQAARHSQLNASRQVEGHPERRTVADLGLALGFFEASPPQQQVEVDLPGNKVITRSFKRILQEMPFDRQTFYVICVKPEKSDPLFHLNCRDCRPDLPIVEQGQLKEPTWNFEFIPPPHFGEMTYTLTAHLLKFSSKSVWESHGEPISCESVPLPFSQVTFRQRPGLIARNVLKEQGVPIWAEIVVPILTALIGAGGAVVARRVGRPPKGSAADNHPKKIIISG